MIGSLIQGILGIAKGAEAGKSASQGMGTYSLSTGKYNDPKKQQKAFSKAAFLNPLGVWRDPNLKGWEKIVAGSGIGGPLVAKRRRERMEAKNAEFAQKYNDVSQKIEDLPERGISPEAEERLNILTTSGDKMGDLAQEAVDVAEARSGEEIPGAEIVRQNLAQGTAQQLEAAKMSGNPMATIPLIGQEQQAQYSQLARENMAYKNQASKDVQNALMDQSQIEAQAAGMQADGLSGMISEKGKQYQSQLDKAITGIDFDITRQAQSQAGYQAQLDTQAAQQAGMTSALSNIATSWLSNRQGGGGGSSNTSWSNVGDKMQNDYSLRYEK